MAGIEKIKESLDTVFDVSEVFVDALEDDNRISFMEMMKILKKMFALRDVISDANELYNEYTDLEDDEYEQIKQYLKNKFTIHDYELEELVEDVFDNLINIDCLIHKIIEYKKQ